MCVSSDRLDHFREDAWIAVEDEGTEAFVAERRAMLLTEVGSGASGVTAKRSGEWPAPHLATMQLSTGAGPCRSSWVSWYIVRSPKLSLLEGR
jgi:hypothetical protein